MTIINSSGASVTSNKRKKLKPRDQPDGDSVQKKPKLKMLHNNKKSSPAGQGRTMQKKNKPKSPNHNLNQSVTVKKRHSSKNMGDLMDGAKKTKKKPLTDETVDEASVSTLPSVSGWDIAIANARSTPLVNQSWEDAVSKARGFPDGTNESKTAHEEEAPKENKEKQRKKVEIPFKQKVSKMAGDKLKGKKEDNIQKKGLKRKSSDSKTGDGAKKAKVDLKEMTKKERKKQRQMSRNNFELIQKMKKIWEDLRRHKLDKEKKEKLCGELFEMVKGHCKELIFAHDSTRIIQTLYKLGSPQIRNSIYDEIKDHILEICKAKYGSNFIKKIFKYGTKAQKNQVLKSFHGKVRKTIRHTVASSVLEYAYNEYANAQQRSALMEEFYGPSFALFKTHEIRTIEQVLNSDPNKRDVILRNMKEALAPLTDKTVVKHTIVHRAFMEFFSHTEAKMRSEMIEAVRESLVEMLHTRDGARVAMYCLWYGTAKDRKVIIKSLKTPIVKICKEEYGHLVLMALFDCVDDTKLVQKAVLQEILTNLHDIAFDKYGIKVLMYLLTPRNTLHFHPDVIRILKKGDSNITSKKEKDVRQRELLDCVSESMLKFLVSHTKELVMVNSTLLLILAILTHAKGDATEAMRAISQIAAEPFVSGSLENYHIVEHTAGHLTLKRLILNDADRMKDPNNTVLFSEVLCDTVPEGSLKSWAACNRGCFILLSMLELNHPSVTEQIKSELEPIKKSLTKMNFKGAQILLNKL